MERNLRAFTPILHSSSGRRPSLSSSSSKLQNSKLSASLRAPKKQSVLAHDTYRTHGFVEQRMTRNFRNYRPAHFDSTDHRFAMGGWNGTCVRLLPFSIPPQQNLLSFSAVFSYPEGVELLIGQGWLFFSAEFSYPEGVELLIGQGWREAPTLSTCRIECIRTL